MSRVARRPVKLPKGVSIDLEGQSLAVKGPKGALSMTLDNEVEVAHEDERIVVTARSRSRYGKAIVGTTRALIQNMVTGVTEGFERKLELVGIGYRAQAQGQKLSLTLGFSHPVEYRVPDQITVETPTQTELVVRGIDRQRVGQIAAELRAFRPPEPYKGKGVRYADERIVLKEAKKK
jgi:large subunit ribosomal protein L6